MRSFKNNNNNNNDNNNDNNDNKDNNDNNHNNDNNDSRIYMRPDQSIVASLSVSIVNDKVRQ